MSESVLWLCGKCMMCNPLSKTDCGRCGKARVVVDVHKDGNEMSDAIASCYAFDNELIEDDENES